MDEIIALFSQLRLEDQRAIIAHLASEGYPEQQTASDQETSDPAKT